MGLKDWNSLPKGLRCPEVKEYYDILKKKETELKLKRCFDICAAGILLILILPVLIVIAVLIKKDSKGPVFFRQERITTYGKKFMIHKFRTMRSDATGSLVTVGNDSRITKIGAVLRRYRLDELPQLIDILQGNMSFVGTRPEVLKYVKQYKPEYRATLLMPAGVTSEACIRYKDEAELLDNADDVDKVYVEQVLPGKMQYNLEDIRFFSLKREMIIMFRTVMAVIR